VAETTAVHEGAEARAGAKAGLAVRAAVAAAAAAAAAIVAVTSAVTVVTSAVTVVARLVVVARSAVATAMVSNVGRERTSPHGALCGPAGATGGVRALRLRRGATHHHCPASLRRANLDLWSFPRCSQNICCIWGTCQSRTHSLALQYAVRARQQTREHETP
jgi:hypothetical protein